MARRNEHFIQPSCISFNQFARARWSHGLDLRLVVSVLQREIRGWQRTQLEVESSAVDLWLFQCVLKRQTRGGRYPALLQWSLHYILFIYYTLYFMYHIFFFKHITTFQKQIFKMGWLNWFSGLLWHQMTKENLIHMLDSCWFLCEFFFWDLRFNKNCSNDCNVYVAFCKVVCSV